MSEISPRATALDLNFTYIGYYPGYSNDSANTKNVLSALVLKAHTSSRGWVRLTGPDPQDKLEINKNQFATPEGQKDLEVLREAMKYEREAVARNLVLRPHVIEEVGGDNSFALFS